MGKMVGIAEFKAKCERLISQMEEDGIAIELTRRGKVVGVLSPPLPPKPTSVEPLPSAFGMLRSDRYRDDTNPEDFRVDPDWEAKWEAKWDERGFPAHGKR